MKRIAILLVMLGTLFGAAISQPIPQMILSTQDTLPALATAYSKGQMMRSTKSYIALSVRVPLNRNDMRIRTGWISRLGVRLDSVCTGTVRVYALKDTTGLTALLSADRAAFQNRDAIDSLRVGTPGYIDIDLSAEGTWAGGARFADGGMRWMQEFDLRRFSNGVMYAQTDRIWFLVETQSAYTPKLSGIIRIEPTIIEKMQ